MDAMVPNVGDVCSVGYMADGWIQHTFFGQNKAATSSTIDLRSSRCVSTLGGAPHARLSAGKYSFFSDARKRRTTISSHHF